MVNHNFAVRHVLVHLDAKSVHFSEVQRTKVSVVTIVVKGVVAADDLELRAVDCWNVFSAQKVKFSSYQFNCSAWKAAFRRLV